MVFVRVNPEVKKIACTMFILFLLSVLSGCSDFSLSDVGKKGENCFGNGTCKQGLFCVDGMCVLEMPEEESMVEEDIAEDSDSLPDEDAEGETVNDETYEKDEENDSDVVFQCANPDFPHLAEGLCWSEKLEEQESWNAAVNRCNGLSGRLPTISELRSLIRDCPATETGGSCGLNDGCLSKDSCWGDILGPCNGCEKNTTGKYSFFEDVSFLWSSSLNSDDENNVWTVDFDQAYIGEGEKDLDGIEIRCVL